MSVTRRTVLIPLVTALTAPWVVGPSLAVPATAASCPAFLAVAAPYATVDGQPRAGTVTLFHGSKKVATLHQGAAGVSGTPERDDAFGSALVKGDFDGDGCADLAIGASEEFSGDRVPGADGNGVVHILYGTPHGLKEVGTVDVTLLGRKYGSDRFGAALAAGDLDGDGDDELVVGVPGLDGGGGVGIFGSGGAEPYGKGRLITQATSWVGQEPGETDQFGVALATGDFDGDGDDELAVGAPGDGGTRSGSGVVTVIDPRKRYAGVYTQESPGVKGDGEKWDAFGAALASGDFNGDGRDDLAIGMPGEDLSTVVRGMDYGDGAVNVLYGSGRGLTAVGSELWSRNTLKGTPHYYDRFGTSLAAGDLNGDGDDELIVGVPGEDAVQVLAGTRSGGLTRENDVLVTGQKGSGFGFSVGVGDGGLLVGSAATGTVTLIGTERKKGPFTGLLPTTARVLTGGAGARYEDAAHTDGAGAGGDGDLFGYAFA
ncbi:FG-GAP repeat protein [Microtetraspora glauca]|uniref:FG-GAP repeat protein n=1 Tax=Microtetraspora glauca TaxID=1996 RepID=A0ABV3GS24_MICGL